MPERRWNDKMGGKLVVNRQGAYHGTETGLRRLADTCARPMRRRPQPVQLLPLADSHLGREPPGRVLCLAQPLHGRRYARRLDHSRCIGFARRWGHGGIVVVNLFALRATDPAELACAVDPVSPENDAALRSHAEGLRIIAAWGNKGSLLGRAEAVLRLLEGCRVECLGGPAPASVVCRRRR